MLILIVEEEHEEHEQDHDRRHLEGKENNEGKCFKQNNEFELDWKAWVLDFFMEYFLASDWLIFIFNVFEPFVPTTVHKVEASQNKLHDQEVEGLVSDHFECLVFFLVFGEIEVEGGDDDVVNEMEENCCQNNEHCPAGLGIGMPHF